MRLIERVPAAAALPTVRGALTPSGCAGFRSYGRTTGFIRRSYTGRRAAPSPQPPPPGRFPESPSIGSRASQPPPVSPRLRPTSLQLPPILLFFSAIRFGFPELPTVSPSNRTASPSRQTITPASLLRTPSHSHQPHRSPSHHTTLPYSSCPSRSSVAASLCPATSPPHHAHPPTV